jgi:hypothetical protein
MSKLKISEFAKICGVRCDQIETVIKKEKIKPLRTPTRKLDNVQQIIIARILYFESKIEWLTFESKMNQN